MLQDNPKMLSVHRIRRGDIHEIHVERWGTAGAIPTLFLHGGPGAGLSRRALQGFDLSRHDLILFDQRGCGKSRPLANCQENTTQHLISDIEAIRNHFGFKRWMVTGGSWGSFLALAYAEAHPGSVSAMRLHGIFLAGQQDIDWWFHGIRHVYPDLWQAFAAEVPPHERADLLTAYYRRLSGGDEAAARSAAWQLRNFSARSQTLEPDEAHIADLLSSPDKFLPISRLFTHYCVNRAFLPEGQILNRLDRIRHIPAEIIQARYDMVTPMISAWRLHRAWPEAAFRIVTLSNHSPTPAMMVELRAAADRLANTITPRPDQTGHNAAPTMSNCDPQRGNVPWN